MSSPDPRQLLFLYALILLTVAVMIVVVQLTNRRRSAEIVHRKKTRGKDSDRSSGEV